MVNVSWDYLPHTLAHHVLDYSLNLEPDFQRGYVWKPEQKVRFVEYALQGGHSGRDLWFNAPGWQGMTGIGEYVLVDGKQRLDAVMGFLNNEFAVFEGSFFRDYTDPISHHTCFNWHVNTLKTRDECLQWYCDLNTGGTVHSDDEIDRVRGLIGKGEWAAPTPEEIRKYAGFDRKVIQDAIEQDRLREEERRANAASARPVPKKRGKK